MDKAQIMGLIRHLLTFGGGFLASHGIVAQGDIETAVGAAVTLIGIVWSALQKKGKAG